MTLEELYKDLHSRPELAFAEHRTAGIAAGRRAGDGGQGGAPGGLTGGPAEMIRSENRQQGRPAGGALEA